MNLDFSTLMDTALGIMKKGPRPLAPLLDFAAQENEMPSGNGLMEELRRHLRRADPNDVVVARLALSVRQWDNEESPDWAKGTSAHSVPRRDVICSRLELSEVDARLLTEAAPPFTRAERATVISTRHEPWYEEGKPNRKTFYWDAYIGQLSTPGSGWDKDAIGILSNSTDDIVSRLSDPTRGDIYPVKGLVVGYVQSGKTAHFTGVIAKAVDAGYRLVIILAGTLNILRRQTQRRLDKELVGKEQIPEGEYEGDSDWQNFLSHKGVPHERGFFDIERLTGLEDDYSPLGARLAALKFSKADPGLPFNHPTNLRRAPVRLVVVKKMPKMLGDLAQDLGQLRKQGARLDDIPTLVIDDESDQASVNTAKPTKAEKQQRTATNAAIVNLLKALPRAQYVGYTATPFANVFIDPSDAEQLFPKDFIVSLPRPAGYMGVKDFFDFDSDPNEEGPNGRRHVRFVKGEDSHKDNLPRAIDLFVLTGAMKLFRNSVKPQLRFKHHTMLVHHAAQVEVHEKQREAVDLMFSAGGFTGRAGLSRLKKVFDTDVLPNLDTELPFPASFDELKPWIAKCIAKLQQDKTVRIVNGDEKNIDDTPDFDGGPVWAILIGGAKLSRGYTVEGLTVSYYRRRAGAGDTLMQMGRWFGFRMGYVDLVRWFVGTEEPIGKSGKKANLYLQFSALCRDEEALRADLTRYADGGDILPIQVPPLVHSHMPSLKPTAKNKMYNAILKFKNLGCKWIEKVAVLDDEKKSNLSSAARLLNRVSLKDATLTGTNGAERKSFKTLAAKAAGEDVLRFLRDFKWANGARSFEHELDYVAGTQGDPGIQRWIVLLPQVKGATLRWLEIEGQQVSIAGRDFDSETGFGVFSEPRHRAIARCLAGVSCDLTDLSPDLKSLAAEGTAILLLYLVYNNEKPKPIRWSDVTIGFAMQLPDSKLPQQIVWSVRNENDREAVIVEAE